MASSGCWKCLMRPYLPLRSLKASNPQLNSTSLPLSFSTSRTRQVLNPKAAQTLAKKAKDKASTKGLKIKTLKIKKKAVVKTGRPPAPGERKAIRKRIVLSNSNALEVRSMENITAELDPVRVGTVMGLPGSLVDQLRAVEAFKTTQAWGLFHRPAMLIREESLEIANIIHEAQQYTKTSVTIIDGERGAGKSMVLLQAMANAFQKGWIILSIPEAQELTNANSAYAPIPGTDPRIYSQSTYTAAWLSQIAKANNALLSSLEIVHQHTLPFPLQSNVSLSRLAELGARDPEVSWIVFQAFWKEITSPKRPPILFVLDGLSHIMKDSAYRSPEYEPVHAHDLAIVKHFVEHLSGEKTLPNGGAIIAATTKSNNPHSYAAELAVKQKLEKSTGKEISKADPWTKLDTRSYTSLQAASIMKLKGLNKAESRALMEYWAASGVLRQRIDEKTVTERWSLAGNGIVGEMERATLRMTI